MCVPYPLGPSITSYVGTTRRATHSWWTNLKCSFGMCVAGDGWGEMETGWGEDDDGWDATEAAPVAPKPAPRRPAKAKSKLKLGVSRKNDGKAD